MGLDTTHDCWHGAYSAFHRWRSALAKAAGLPPLDFMEGFWVPPAAGGDSGMALTIRVAAGTLNRFDDEWLARNPRPPPAPGVTVLDREGDRLLKLFDFPAIRWDALKPDVLHELLHHSDCEGHLDADWCAPLADRLEQLLPQLPDGEGGGHIGNWRDKTQKFIDGLRLAASKCERVEFH